MIFQNALLGRWIWDEQHGGHGVLPVKHEGFGDKLAFGGWYWAQRTPVYAR